MRFPWRIAPEDRERRRMDRTLALGFRGTFTQPEAQLPEGFVLPSAALAAPKPATYVTTIDDAFRDRVREWLKSYAVDAMLRGITLSLPSWLPLRETGIRFYIPPATSGGLDLYQRVEPAARDAYVVLVDGSEVAVPVPKPAL